MRCGQLDFEFRDTRRYAQPAGSAHDHPRLECLLQTARQPRAAIDALAFDIWVHLRAAPPR